MPDPTQKALWYDGHDADDLGVGDFIHPCNAQDLLKASGYGISEVVLFVGDRGSSIHSRRPLLQIFIQYLINLLEK